MGRKHSGPGWLAVAAAALAPVPGAAQCGAVEGPLPGSPEARAIEAAQRRECAKVADDREGYLRDVRRGRHEYYDVLALAENLSAGTMGCAKDDAQAVRLLEATIAKPIPLDAEWWQLDGLARFLPRAEGAITRERRREIEAMHWLLAPTAVSLAAHGWSSEEIDRFLIQPGRWEFALANFGSTRRTMSDGQGGIVVHYGSRNPEVDAAVFRLLTDPLSPRFEPRRAISLGADSSDLSYRRVAIDLLLDAGMRDDILFARDIAAASTDRGLQIEVARRLLEPPGGTLRVDAAAALLGWYSPYVHVAPEEDAAAAELWQTIARQFVASSDPGRRARGEALLRSGGGPHPSLALVPEVVGALVVLDRWPEALAPLDLGPPGRWSGAYPARAMRDEQAGRVGVSLLFGPDGAFAEPWVARSSGSGVLDEATKTLLLSYARPKLADLKLTGYAGRSVLVPLAEVEWHIGATAERPAGATVEGRRIVVVEQPISRATFHPPVC